MSHLTSFAPHLHAVIIGATGGIGAAFADLLEADPAVAAVTRLSRSTGLDLANPASIIAAAAGLTVGAHLFAAEEIDDRPGHADEGASVGLAPRPAS